MFNVKAFLEALDEIEASKGISKEDVIFALKEALEKGFKKQLGGDDAKVVINLDTEKGILDMYQEKDVVEEVEDDFLQISVEDANLKAVGKKVYKVGDVFEIHQPTAELQKATALNIKAVLRQKLAEKEKEALYKTYEEKENEMITGRVEKIDNHGVTVNIGRTSVYIGRKDLIGDEMFRLGDPIKLYISTVSSDLKGGAKISVSRSNEGFLKRLFEDEISEIYDGTIVIKAIARRAGERSKIAVYSKDPNVDPAGACIGSGGSRIKRIVEQLGNIPEKENREKIDVIEYSENPGLFIMESLKPAKVVGIKYDPSNKTATAIIQNDSLSTAIGRRGVNVALASRLTNYNIDIKEEKDAEELGIEYQTYDQLKELAEQAMLRVQDETVVKTTNNNQTYVAPNERVYEEETISIEERESLEEVVEKEEISSSFEMLENEDNVGFKEIEAVKKEEVKPEIKKVEVNIGSTLQSLEQQLEQESKKKSDTQKSNFNKKKFNKNNNDEEESKTETVKTTISPVSASYYTEEQLQKMDEEDLNEDSDDFDFEEDDFDSYLDY